jgi:choline dehydrogenase-like flavoprotein
MAFGGIPSKQRLAMTAQLPVTLPQSMGRLPPRICIFNIVHHRRLNIRQRPASLIVAHASVENEVWQWKTMIKVENLASFDSGSLIKADVVIVGGGPAGLTIAREFLADRTDVLLLESGLSQETPEHAELALLESVGEPKTDLQKQKRMEFHGASSRTWSQDGQPYGVRCRALGGSTHAWAGKSAAFDPIDFAARPWIPNSGWPFDHSHLEPFINRALRLMNLSVDQPRPRFDTEALRSFYWQFARSRLDHLDIMRFGQEFLSLDSSSVRVLVNATATKIHLNTDGNRFESLEIATIDGRKSRVQAAIAVIAGGGVENPRLLLASNAIHHSGIGNDYDQVGRFLMDHPGARVGRFDSEASSQIIRQFGFQGVKSERKMHMFTHGLSLTPAIQEREKLPNSAIYFMQERSPDDPWDALKRLIRRKSDRPFDDFASLVRGSGLVLSGLGIKILASELPPKIFKNLIVNSAIRINPNFVAEEFQSRGLPRKLGGISVDAITEQRPNPDSRVTLSDRTDRLGVPLAKVDWRVEDDDRRGLSRIAQLTRDLFFELKLPELKLEPWILEERPRDGIIIDMAHTLGTTRMSESPRSGVVDAEGMIHGVHGLYVAGGSVFPTSGHANPTLMIVALSIRLADSVKRQLQQI